LAKDKAKKGTKASSSKASNKTQVEKAPRLAAFQPEFYEDLGYWITMDQTNALKILRLVRESLTTPFTGIGKPEPLKYLAPNTWSRRITDGHRLVYVVFDDKIEFHQARYHYSDS
jgi:toxin YoeB